MFDSNQQVNKLLEEAYEYEISPNGIDGRIPLEQRRDSASNFERMGKARAGVKAGKGTSGLAKTSSFFTPITAHSMFDYSIILELDQIKKKLNRKEALALRRERD